MEGGDWSSFNGVFANEEADFMAQLFPSNVSVAPLMEYSNLYSTFSQESCYSGSSCITNYPTASHDNYYISDNSNNNTNSFLAPNYNNATFEESGEVEHADDNKHLMSPDKESDYPRKRARASDAPPKGKRNANKSKKRQKVGSVEDDNNGGLNRQSSSNFSSEDESNLSLELNNGVSSLTNGKTRASRGSATDPQSLYARKRRERINERLRILQGLVPNGTKVDISTMLEEAVEYVKFLQLQIKLLSSDDLWMYSPIAYNGMDIGLDLRINASKS